MDNVEYRLLFSALSDGILFTKRLNRPRNGGRANPPMNPTEADQKFADAKDLFNAKDYEQALAILDDLLGAFPDSREYALAKAENLSQLGRVDEAGEVLQSLGPPPASSPSPPSEEPKTVDPPTAQSHSFEASELVSTFEVDLGSSAGAPEAPQAPKPAPVKSKDGDELVATSELDLNADVQDMVLLDDETEEREIAASETPASAPERPLSEIPIPDPDNEWVSADSVEIVHEAPPQSDDDVEAEAKDVLEAAEPSRRPTIGSSLDPLPEEPIESAAFDTPEISKPEIPDPVDEFDLQNEPKQSAASELEPLFDTPVASVEPDDETSIDVSPDRQHRFNSLEIDAPERVVEPQTANESPPQFDAPDASDAFDAPAAPGAGDVVAEGSKTVEPKRIPITKPRADTQAGKKNQPGGAYIRNALIAAVCFVGLGAAAWFFLLNGSDPAQPAQPAPTAGPAPSGPTTPEPVAVADPNVQGRLFDAIELGDRVLVAELVEEGASMEGSNPDGFSLLTYAIRSSVPENSASIPQFADDRYVGIIATLINGGADPDVADAKGRTALGLAIAMAPADIVKLLLENNASVTPNAAHAFATSCRAELAPLFFENGAAAEDTSLFFAAVDSNCIPMVDAFLTFGADANATNESGANAVALALLGTETLLEGVRSPNSNKPTAISQKSLDMTAHLIGRGASVDDALPVVAERGSRDHVDVLLAQGADVTAADGLIFSAIRSGRKSTIDLLLEKGVNMDVFDESGRTPLEYAQRVQTKLALDPEILLLLKRMSAVGAVRTTEQRVERPQAAAGEVLFPADRSIGAVYRSDRSASSGWTKIADAKGTFKSDPDQLLYLDLKPGSPDDLAVLSELAYYSVSSLRLIGPAVNDQTIRPLARYKKLTHLELHRTNVTDDGLAVFSNVDTLVSFAVTSIKSEQSASISGDGLLHLIELPKLRDLNLTCTNLTSRGANFISRIDNLHSLNLSGTRITDAGLAVLRSLDNLESLNLGDRAELQLDITGWGLFPLDGLTNLRELSLYGVEFTNSSVEILKKYKNLTRLNLAGTDFNDEWLDHLAELEHLERLDLRGSSVSAEAVEKLKTSLPNLQVET